MEVAGDHMVGAIKDITINQGIDPRESLLVAGGGAAGLNIVPIARELGCRQVLVPRTAGALSACGGQYSDIVSEFTQSRFAYTGDFPFEAVNRVLAEITASMDRLEAELRERGLTRFKREYFVEARYPYQVWELDVALPKGRFEGQADLDATIEAFHREHERVFAVKEPGQQVECVYWRGRLTALLDGPAADQDGGARGGVARGTGAAPGLFCRPWRARYAALSWRESAARDDGRGSRDHRRADHHDRGLSGKPRARDRVA